MLRTLRWSLPVLLVSSLYARPGVQDGWWSDLYEEKVVPLEEVLAEPQAFRGLTIATVVQFHRLEKLDNPYYTKFGDDHYMNFSAWSDGAALWNKEAYRDAHRYFFIPRMAAGVQSLITAPMYGRFALTVRVEDVFKGMPWIEVTGIERLDRQMNETSLRHIVKGIHLRAIHRYDAAATAFQAAVSPQLPPSVHAMVLREEAMALHAGGKIELATAVLQNARAVNPGDPLTDQALVKVTGRPLPEEEPVDRAAPIEGPRSGGEVGNDD